MTKKEFFEQIAQGAIITEEMVEIAQTELESLAKRAAKEAEKKAEKAAVDGPLREKIFNEILDKETFTTGSAIAEILEISVHKVPHLMKPLVEDGTVEKGEVKDGKTKKVGYKRA